MWKNVHITICSSLQAKSRAKAYGQHEFISDDEIFGISVDLFDTISKTPFTIVNSTELTYYIINEISGERHVWYIPKIFFDIKE